MEREAKYYYQQVKSNLAVSPTNRKPLMKILQKSLVEFSKSAPLAVYEDYEEYFGTPEEYAETLLDELTSNNIRKNLKEDKNFKIICIALIFMLLLALIASIIFCIHYSTFYPIYIDLEKNIVKYY